MLRYVIWRLLFEAANFRRLLLGHGRERVLYLAFGANLCDAILQQRRIHPFAARRYTLNDHALRFDHPSPWSGCGYASAEYAPGEKLYGYLYTLSARDAERMDFYEAVPVINRYRRCYVEQGGERIFFYQTRRSTPGLKPTAQYLGYIVDGLRAHPDVDADYFERLAATATAAPGRYVSSYLAPQPSTRAAWLRRVNGLYQRAVLILFLHLLYRFSLLAPLIRARA